MKIFKFFILFISLQTFTRPDFVILNSLEDAQNHPELTKQLGEQLRRLSKHVVVYSITENSTNPLLLDLQKSQQRRENLIPLLESLGLEVTIIDALTPSDIDHANWEKIKAHYFHGDGTDLDKNLEVRSKFFSQPDWPEIIKSEVGNPYWTRCHNWKRKIPGTEIKDTITDEIIKPAKKASDPLSGLRQMACFESHLKSLKAALDKFGDANIILLEDDTNFAASPDIIKELKIAIDELDEIENWTKLSLGASFARENLKINPRQIGWRQTSNLTLLKGANGTFAQVINGRNLKYLINLIQEYLIQSKAYKVEKILAIDSLMAQYEVKNLILNLGLNPLLCGQAHEYSMTMNVNVHAYVDPENTLLLRQGIKFDYPGFSPLIKPRDNGFYNRIKEPTISAEQNQKETSTPHNSYDAGEASTSLTSTLERGHSFS